jgi:CheY-like chemotaxis protein
MMDQKRILLVSRDIMVLQTRKLMLGAYFDVSAAGRVVEAQRLLFKQSFDLIVLCYTLTHDDCQKIIESVRSYSPEAKFLVLTITGLPIDRLDVRAYCLPAEQGPFILVKKSAELLGFEFKSKGRMVPTSHPASMVA